MIEQQQRVVLVDDEAGVEEIVFDAVGQTVAVEIVLGEVDEVVDMVVEKGQLEAVAASGLAPRQVDVVGRFLAERQIADLERVRREMRPAGDHPLDARCALGPRARPRHRPARAILVAGAAGETQQVEAAALAADPIARAVGLVAQAGVDMDAVEVGLLEDEHRDIVLRRRRHEGFLADGGDRAIPILQADHAIPGTQPMDQFDATFISSLLKRVPTSPEASTSSWV